MKTAEPRARTCCGPGCREASGSASHYDAKYFAWQAIGGVEKAKKQNWAQMLRAQPDDTVLDFGAGTGAILSTLGERVKRKVAVEYNDHAREYMRRNHPEISLHKYPEDVPDGSISLIFSTSVIEHVECPIQELRELRRKLIPGGRAAIGIKNEGVELWRPWTSGNRDNHLYTWNSMLLGNTMRAAGFVVDEIISSGTSVVELERSIIHKGFGTRGHTFQYLWAHAHARRAGEAWPQLNRTAPLRLSNRKTGTADRHLGAEEALALHRAALANATRAAQARARASTPPGRVATGTAGSSILRWLKTGSSS